MCESSFPLALLRAAAFFLFFGGTVSAQENISLRSVVTFDRYGLNDVWGYADSSGREYALVGGVSGFSIVSLQNPDQPDILFKIPGDTTTWRDIKTWKDRAYVTTDGKGSGLLIVDLSMLPDSIDYHYWTKEFDDSTSFKVAHNLFIDEFGYLYLFGSNIQKGGALILDLTDVDSPSVSGFYDERYCHDGMVRDNLMYTAEIRDGTFSIVDVSDKSSLQILGQAITPNAFTHNIWVSDDGNTVFTTDERKNAFVAAYDVSDPTDINELDRYQSSPSDSVIPHNVHVFGDHLVTSYYADGVTIVDATRPHNLVEVGAYDTSPFPSAAGFGGCWGAYPYLPSGLLLATDRREGLFVLDPNYTRGAYLEGTVIDDSSGMGLSGVRVELVGTDRLKYSNFVGEYATGVAQSGEYDLRLFHRNCQTILVPRVRLQQDSVTFLNFEMDCNFPPPPPVGLNAEPSDTYLEDMRLAVIGSTIKITGIDMPGKYSTSLIDINGRLISQKLHAMSNSEPLLLQLEHQLASGIYLLMLSDGKHQVNRRFSIMRQ